MIRVLAVTACGLAIVGILFCGLGGRLARYTRLAAAKPVAASTTPPTGLAVYSLMTAPAKNTKNGYILPIYSLFMRKVPGNSKPVELTRVKGNGAVRLGSTAWYPVFSPDGKTVLFLGSHPNVYEDDMLYDFTRIGLDLYLVDCASQRLTRLTKEGGGYRDYAWSADSDWITAYSINGIYQLAGSEAKPDTSVLLFNVSSGTCDELVRYREVDPPIEDVMPLLSSGVVPFQRSGDPTLYGAATDKTGAITLVPGKDLRYRFAYSPNEQRVAYVQEGKPSVQPSGLSVPSPNSAVYVAYANGSSPALVAKKTLGPGSYFWKLRPAWSPDGHKLAAVEVENAGGTLRSAHIYVYDVFSNRTSAANVGFDVEAMKWSRDSKWVILTIRRAEKVAASEEYYEGLLAIRIADGKQFTLTQPKNITHGIDWIETP